MALIAVLLVWLSLSVVCVMKGKPWFGAIGFLAFGVFSLVGAIRLAKPDSYWASRWYGPRTLEQACERFPKSADRLDAPEAASQ